MFARAKTVLTSLWHVPLNKCNLVSLVIFLLTCCSCISLGSFSTPRKHQKISLPRAASKISAKLILRPLWQLKKTLPKIELLHTFFPSNFAKILWKLVEHFSTSFVVRSCVCSQRREIWLLDIDENYVNLFQPNVPFLCRLKMSANRTFLDIFMGIVIGLKWVIQMLDINVTIDVIA